MSDTAVAPIEIRIEGLETVLRFKTLEKAREWAASESNKWTKTLDAAVQWGNPIHDEIRNNLNHIARVANADNEDTLRSAINIFRKQKVICSESPVGKAIVELAAINPHAAVARFAIARGINAQAPVIDRIRGVIQAELFERDPSNLKGIEKAAFQRLRQEWDAQFRELEDNVRTNIASAQTELENTAQLRIEKDIEFSEALFEHKARLENMEKLFKNDLRVGAPADYFSTLAKTHAGASGLFFIAFCLLAIGVSTNIWSNRIELVTLAKDLAQSQQVNIGGALLLSIPVLLVLWVMRLLARQFVRSATLQADAKHRVVLVQTYKALMADPECHVTEDQRLLILQALFRPGPDGASDDAPPPSLLELMTKK